MIGGFISSDWSTVLGVNVRLEDSPAVIGQLFWMSVRDWSTTLATSNDWTTVLGVNMRLEETSATSNDWSTVLGVAIGGFIRSY